jgi:Phytanoyl-CoA dioxygenase (PhyH)
MSSMTDVARIFTDAKTVDSRALNRAGVQPLRAVTARLLYRLRPGSRDPLMTELRRTGVVQFDDFLPPSMLEAVTREASDFVDEGPPTWLYEHGTTQVRQFGLVGMDVERFPHLAQWRNQAEVAGLASGAERRNCGPIDGGSLVEQVVLGDYSVHDIQTDLHVDTFFNTHKLWLYLDDVTEANAAFVYVPGSHLLDGARLRQEYRASLAGDQEKSRRVTDDEVRARGLEKRVITCRRNTLMIANTCGYHCRSVGEPGASRLALHKAFRFNPFNPFTPVPGTNYRSRMRSGVRRVAADSVG